MSQRTSSKLGDILILDIGSDDDDFLGEVKPSAGSATPISSNSRAASPRAVQEVPSVTAPSRASTSCQLEDAAPTTASSRRRQHIEADTDPAECRDLREKLNRIRGHRRRMPKGHEAHRNTDLGAWPRHVDDKEPSCFSRRRMAFLSEGTAGKAHRRHPFFRNARRPSTYVDLDRPAEEYGNDENGIGGFPAPHLQRDFFRPGNKTPDPSILRELEGQWE